MRQEDCHRRRLVVARRGSLPYYCTFIMSLEILRKVYAPPSSPLFIFLAVCWLELVGEGATSWRYLGLCEV